MAGPGRVNLSGARWAVRRLLAGRGGTLADVAHEVDVLAPTGEITVPPALYLPGQPERIRGFSPWRDPDYERASLLGGRVPRGATACIVLRDADIVGPTLYVGRSRTGVGVGREGLWADAEREVVEAPSTLVTTFSGSRWFGCLLLDDFNFEVDADNPLRMVTRDYSQEAPYRALLGLEGSRTVRHARVPTLRVLDEPATGDGRRERHRALRARLRERVPPGERGGRVFLRRGGDGEQRPLVNADAVEARLTSLGFAILDPRAMEPEEVARRTLDAAVVAGLEGSHLSHALFSMAHDAAFLVLQPPDRFALPYKDFTDIMGMRFAFVVGRPVERGFTVDPSELARTVELLDRDPAPAVPA